MVAAQSREKLGPKVRPGAPRRSSSPGRAKRAGAERRAGAGPRREGRGGAGVYYRLARVHHQQ